MSDDPRPWRQGDVVRLTDKHGETTAVKLGDMWTLTTGYRRDDRYIERYAPVLLVRDSAHWPPLGPPIIMDYTGGHPCCSDGSS